MIMRLCEPDGWDDRDGLVGSADAFVVDYGVKRVCALFTRRILRCSSEPSSAMELSAPGAPRSRSVHLHPRHLTQPHVAASSCALTGPRRGCVRTCCAGRACEDGRALTGPS